MKQNLQVMQPTFSPLVVSSFLSGLLFHRSQIIVEDISWYIGSF
jgi:hypothetical protein